MTILALTCFAEKFALFCMITGTQGLPQWPNGLRRDVAYTPIAYNPVYGPRDGHAIYTYGGFGPQPTAVAASGSSFSNSETSANPVGSSTPFPSTTSTNGESAPSIRITSPTTSLPGSTTPVVQEPMMCKHDNCLRQFLRSSAVTNFCATYTTADNTAKTGLPLFISHCSGLPSRISSACSCAVTPSPNVSLPPLPFSTSSYPLYTYTSAPSAIISTSFRGITDITTTSTVHVIKTVPETIYPTNPIPSGTGSSGVTSVLPGSSGPYPFKNYTSPAGPTGTFLSSISVGIWLSSASEYLPTQISSSFPSSSSGPSPYFPISNSSSIFGTAPVPSGSVTVPQSIATYIPIPGGSSLTPYYLASNSSFTSVPSGIVPISSGIFTGVPSKMAPIVYPTGNSTSVGHPTWTCPPSSLSSNSILALSTDNSSPTAGSSTPNFPLGNFSSTAIPIGTGTLLSSFNSPATPTPSGNPNYPIPGNTTSIPGPTGSNPLMLSSASSLSVSILMSTSNFTTVR